jgi:hypothetical protein
MLDFDEETAKLTLNYDRIRGLTPVVIQAKISLIDPEFPNCFTYTISSQILINLKPILKVNRIDLNDLPNKFFYHEIRDFTRYFIEEEQLDPRDIFDLSYDFDTNYDSWLQASLTTSAP